MDDLDEATDGEYGFLTDNLERTRDRIQRLISHIRRDLQLCVTQMLFIYSRIAEECRRVLLAWFASTPIEPPSFARYAAVEARWIAPAYHIVRRAEEELRAVVGTITVFNEVTASLKPRQRRLLEEIKRHNPQVTLVNLWGWLFDGETDLNKLKEHLEGVVRMLDPAWKEIVLEWGYILHATHPDPAYHERWRKAEERAAWEEAEYGHSEFGDDLKQQRIKLGEAKIAELYRSNQPILHFPGNIRLLSRFDENSPTGKLLRLSP
jgi:hypothetical protein